MSDVRPVTDLKMALKLLLNGKLEKEIDGANHKIPEPDYITVDGVKKLEQQLKTENFIRWREDEWRYAGGEDQIIISNKLESK